MHHVPHFDPRIEQRRVFREVSAMKTRFWIFLAARWNVGWQFYNYREEFGLLGYYQNFHAHTGYTSVSWAF